MKSGKLKEGLLEALLELLLAVILGALGWGILKLLNVEWSWDSADPDTLVLIGIVSIALVGAVIGGIWFLIHKARKRHK